MKASVFRHYVLLVTGIAVLVLAVFTTAVLADSFTLNFETYTPGTVNGQDGWSSFGTVGSGCAVYDHQIVNNSGAPAGFGARSLRISNAVTSGCFSDQTFSRSLLNEAGLLIILDFPWTKELLNSLIIRFLPLAFITVCFFIRTDHRSPGG